jgi:hypothetical protein
MLLIILTFLLTTAFYAILLYLACRRISRHLQRTPEGVKAVTAHVLLPLLNRPPDEETDHPPGQTETP